MDNLYLFIDGEYARAIYRSAMDRVFGAAGELRPEKIIYQVQRTGMAVFRTFFYDCLDDTRKENESEMDFAARVKAQENYFDDIKARSGIHLRFGTLAGGKRRRQKEQVTPPFSFWLISVAVHWL